MPQQDNPKRANPGGAPVGASAGIIWFIGWLFTIGFTQPVWWQIIVGIVIWPYFLGVALR